MKAASAQDAGQRFERWGMCAALALFALIFAGLAWWWWSGWSHFSF